MQRQNRRVTGTGRIVTDYMPFQCIILSAAQDLWSPSSRVPAIPAVPLSGDNCYSRADMPPVCSLRFRRSGSEGWLPCGELLHLPQAVPAAVGRRDHRIAGSVSAIFRVEGGGFRIPPVKGKESGRSVSGRADRGGAARQERPSPIGRLVNRSLLQLNLSRIYSLLSI